MLPLEGAEVEEGASLLQPAEADQEVEEVWRRGVGADADAAAVAATEAVPRVAGVGAGPSVPPQSPFQLNRSDWCYCCRWSHRRRPWSSRKEMR